MRNSALLVCILLVCFGSYLRALPKPKNYQSRSGDVTIIDARHYSRVFGEIRNYRIFLPPNYFANTGKRYPVIYFLHGWSQRYFGDGGQNFEQFDKGEDNKGDNIANFVSTHDVIVVKSDGYNRDRDEKYYLRPYNIGPVETFRQFPIYFPELVEYIDANYQTIADREHRAISGLSMGGFMSFWIGGKYPDLFSAAGNFCGSAEFEVGPKDFPVEYRHIDMYKNYGGMNLRLHYGDKDFIRCYHQDMNRVWPQLLDNYACKIFDAEHSTCGLGEMFGFLFESFEKPPARPQKWSHIDVYPEFSAWGYQISSDRIVPGFTILENVDARGFKCAVREFLPDGEVIPFVKLSVTTPPLYEKNQLYTINDIEPNRAKSSQQTIRSDNAGRLKIPITGNMHQIGINKKEDKPNIGIASVALENTSWATKGKEVTISITLFNKGMSAAKNLRAVLTATRSGTNVIKKETNFGSIAVNESKPGQNAFEFVARVDSMEVEQFKLTIRDDSNNEWYEIFDIPLKKDVPEMKDFEIADGKVFTVAKSGIDSETVLLGNGNGDGVANPGESIVILLKDRDKYWRTHLFFSDKYINPFDIHIRKSDSWTMFDYVGASAKYSVPLISSDCPQDHRIKFFAEYWLPEYPMHIIKQGIISVPVTGKDKTVPMISWARIPGDNVIHVKVYDGSKVGVVKARLILKDDPSKSIEVKLKDDGSDEDRVEGDRVFSGRIPGQKFGLYRVLVEAIDGFGNRMLEEVPGNFVVH